MNFLNKATRSSPIKCSALIGVFMLVLGSASAWAAPTLTVGEVSGAAGTTVQVPVSFNPGGESIAAFNLTITIQGASNFTSFTPLGLDDEGNYSACPTGLAPISSVTTISCSVNAGAGTVSYVVDRAGNNPISALQFGLIEFVISGSATVGDYALEITTESYGLAAGGSATPGDSTDGQVSVIVIAPALTRTPETLSFSAENGSTSAAQTIAVSNSGNQDGLIITGATVPTGSRFNVVSNTCQSAAPGLAQAATCTIGVTFSPNAIASFTDTLTITSNAGSATVGLSGQGTAGPAGALTISPTTRNFGTLLTSQGTATQAFTVTNSGATGSTVAIASAAVTGAGMTISNSTCTSANLAAGASCVVTVQFAPAADGSVTGSLTVTGTDANATSLSASATLSGAGETKAIFRSTPAAGSTQTEVAGAEGEASFTISLFNDGNASYAFSSALTSGDSGIFTITGGSGTVAAFSGGSAGSSAITVSCDLPDFETYEATVTVTVGSDTYVYNFTCVGRPPLPVPTMSVWSLTLMALMLMLMAGFGMRTVRTRR